MMDARLKAAEALLTVIKDSLGNVIKPALFKEAWEIFFPPNTMEEEKKRRAEELARFKVLWERMGGLEWQKAEVQRLKDEEKIADAQEKADDILEAQKLKAAEMIAEAEEKAREMAAKEKKRADDILRAAERTAERAK